MLICVLPLVVDVLSQFELSLLEFLYKLVCLFTFGLSEPHNFKLDLLLALLGKTTHLSVEFFQSDQFSIRCGSL